MASPACAYAVRKLAERRKGHWTTGDSAVHGARMATRVICITASTTGPPGKTTRESGKGGTVGLRKYASEREGVEGERAVEREGGGDRDRERERQRQRKRKTETERERGGERGGGSERDKQQRSSDVYIDKYTNI